MIRLDGENVTVNQAAKKFVHLMGMEASARWKSEYENFSMLSEDEIAKIDAKIKYHLPRVWGFLNRKAPKKEAE